MLLGIRTSNSLDELPDFIVSWISEIHFVKICLFLYAFAGWKKYGCIVNCSSNPSIGYLVIVSSISANRSSLASLCSKSRNSNPLKFLSTLPEAPISRCLLFFRKSELRCIAKLSEPALTIKLG